MYILSNLYNYIINIKNKSNEIINTFTYYNAMNLITQNNSFTHNNNTNDSWNHPNLEDLKQIDPNARTISLEDAVRQNGGSLNMEQMMKLMDG